MNASPTRSVPASPGRRKMFSRVVSVASVLLLAVGLFSPARQLVDPSLDHSNYATYAYFTAHGFHYGPEVVPMAGPYGFVPYGSLYAGNLFAKRFALELLTKLALGALIVWLVRRHVHSWVRWIWPVVFLLLVPFVEDLAYDLTILLAGLCLLDRGAGSRRWLVDGMLTALLALLTLFKGTHALLSLATLGLLAMQCLLLRTHLRLVWSLGSYLATVLVLLLVAGQNPPDLPLYFRSTFELSAGYNVAMVLEEPPAAFATGVGALGGLLLMLLVAFGRRWREPGSLASGLLLAGFAFVEWKHGFVRADGHVYIFYQFACIAAPLFWLVGGEGLTSRPRRIGLAGLAGLVAALGLWGDGPASLARHRWLLTQVPGHVAHAARQLFFPAASKAELNARLDARRRIYDLPEVRTLVDGASIDFFGTEHGYLLLNRLNYRPRPVCGGAYNVYTSWLHDRNLRHMADPAVRPDWFLVRPETIDQRFLAQDDAGTLRALLACYAPAATEQGLVLFRARSGSAEPSAPRLLGAQRFNFNEPIIPPPVATNEMLAVELSLPLNPLGRLRSLLYKAPVVFLSLEGEGLEQAASRRVVPELFTRPVILDPVLEDIRDVLALYRDTPGKTVRRFHLHTDHPGLFVTSGFELRFHALPRPQPAVAAAERILAELAHPAFNSVPTEMVPANAPLRRFDGLLVQMLEPPGFTRFPLTGAENAVTFTYGIDPEAYTRGRTDGVQFFVELERPGQPAQGLFHRHLQPAAVPGDRGYQQARVVLPPLGPGDSLLVRTGIGPNNDGAWDWAFFSGVTLGGHGFIPEQFPGFDTLPAAVHSVSCGRLAQEGREYFMLHAPGTLEFALGGTESTLRFAGGLLPGAYTGGGASDGVTFNVDVQEPGGPVRRIFSRHLNPRDQADDRGTCVISVPLPRVPAGTRLLLATAPGPSGNAAWDWSYVERLRLE